MSSFNTPYPLSGSFISTQTGITVTCRREEDALAILHRAIETGAIVFHGDYGQIFRGRKVSDTRYIIETVDWPKTEVVNETKTKDFCRIYGLEFRNDGP